MILFKLAYKSLLNRRASVLLTLLTIAISVMLLLSIERVRVDAKSSFSNTISGTDLIVGARTGDIQLLLSSVFRIGHTNNGVSWQSYQYITKQRGVKWSIPISLGDSHKGQAVLGTTLDYFKHYRFAKKQPLVFEQGQAFSSINEVVIGSEVAKKLAYQIGDEIVISHGMGNTSFHHHDDNPFKVVGILKPTGTPVDKTLHVPLAAIELIHGGGHHDHDDHHDHSSHALIGHPKQITAFLMGFDSPLYTLQIRRNINQYKQEPLLAIMPTVTLKELWEMLAIIEKILLLFSFVVVIISLLGMLTTLLANLNQRRRELAILRSVGARPWQLFSLISMESLLTTFLGCLIGCILFYALMGTTAGYLQSQAGVSINISMLSDYELTLIGVIMAAGFIIGLIPATRAYFYSLSDGMSIKI
ncbi:MULTISPECIES: ABC transporter permease [Pseudoalteromonas]|jgi:putative ABC transport system permease protein|uniref:ABC transporter permease n=2 Tax=Pseudoalteromonas TaxID=53246 RepID=A0AB39AQU8_9GAMM|nr:MULTISPECIES: ABC transporter permease [Pseudoalteromonas]KYL35231.1 peptide ABC transporter permease [Pseudoalteromonas spiralis]MDN3395028.1 ABC transporter permease [Pseudoalteromonas sp. APC 3215]MDN3401095.1 ABC transporter permease [Pseudoalteromonas sp. APC 3213]MDN3404990.1 ABC transporter permease [Pseudoalteromonas sp. APC 3218]MDN3408943.1 ABC transporter permease [Pseudoalteromonas sp. APC 3894]|tara:strand:+ start:19877 stop:21124 length:1248 start_codon:yes stop_codon:yes gene_type:complete